MTTKKSLKQSTLTNKMYDALPETFSRPGNYSYLSQMAENDAGEYCKGGLLLI